MACDLSQVSRNLALLLWLPVIIVLVPRLPPSSGTQFEHGSYGFISSHRHPSTSYFLLSILFQHRHWSCCKIPFQCSVSLSWHSYLNVQPLPATGDCIFLFDKVFGFDKLSPPSFLPSDNTASYSLSMACSLLQGCAEQMEQLFSYTAHRNKGPVFQRTEVVIPSVSAELSQCSLRLPFSMGKSPVERHWKHR